MGVTSRGGKLSIGGGDVAPRHLGLISIERGSAAAQGMAVSAGDCGRSARTRRQRICRALWGCQSAEGEESGGMRVTEGYRLRRGMWWGAGWPAGRAGGTR